MSFSSFSIHKNKKKKITKIWSLDLKKQGIFYKIRKITMFRKIVRNPLTNVKKLSALSQFQTEHKGITEIGRDEALQHPDYFSVHNLFTVKDLFDARVHYGHKEGSLDERMLPYIYGSRLGHIIFDLDKTAVHLRQALNVAAHIAYRGGIILFFLRGAQNSHIVECTAKECNEYAHTRFWRGGIFTNAEKQFGAVTRLPDLCIFFNTLNNVLIQHTAIRDSAKMSIATIGIVDSNCNPNLLTYPVPGNDDSSIAIEFYCKVFKNAIMRGKQKRLQEQQ